MGAFYAELDGELTLHVRMMAWLAAVPRAHAGAKDQGPKLSRGEQMARGGITPAMPPLSAPWFIEHLIELGIVEATGMGQAPLSWPTIHAWQAVTGTPLAPWQGRLLRKLSSAFLSARSEGEDPLCQPPFFAEPIAVDHDRAELQLKAALFSAAG